MTATEQALDWCHWLASRGVTISQDEMREMFEKPLMENAATLAETRERLLRADVLIEAASAYFADHETAPNERWWKQFFLFDGAHMILTEEGWEDGCGKEQYEKDAQEDGVPLTDFIRDEVNAPKGNL